MPQQTLKIKWAVDLWYNTACAKASCLAFSLTHTNQTTFNEKVCVHSSTVDIHVWKLGSQMKYDW